MSNRKELQTIVLIKPDALKNSLTGYILSQLSEYHTGLCFAGAKVITVPEILAQEHYAEHREKPFFPALIEYIRGAVHYPDDPQKRRVIALLYQGPDAVRRLREFVGPTNPHKARDNKPGCIRSLGTVVPIRDENGKEIGDRMDNLIHASANEEEAEKEIKLWFTPNDVPPPMWIFPTVRADKHYYVKGDQLLTAYEPGSKCIIAPGDDVWESDWQTLQEISDGQDDQHALHAVIAKYFINDGQA